MDAYKFKIWSYDKSKRKYGSLQEEAAQHEIAADALAHFEDVQGERRRERCNQLQAIQTGMIRGQGFYKAFLFSPIDAAEAANIYDPYTAVVLFPHFQIAVYLRTVSNGIAKQAEKLAALLDVLRMD